MNFQLRISLALLFSAWMATSACGQFPWSGNKDAAPEGRKTGSITWKSDLPEALKLAREQRKLVFLHFSGTHCPPCRKLEDNVLNRNDVAVTMLSRFVPVFIVVEQAEDLVERFHVQSWPTDVILDAEGREIARHVSPQNPQEFIKRISSISAKHHAGQSTTMANVRAAVASDVTEATTPVQQTAADDRVTTPTQPPRAESKIVRNPHTPDSRLPPIVARNNKAKKTIVQSGDREEEGFSPPSERRKPEIVRRADEPKQVAARAKRDEEPADDEPAVETDAEGDVAPWRKNLIAKKAAKQVEVAKEAAAKEAPAEEPAEEMELEAAPDETAIAETEEPATEDEPEPKLESMAEEKAANEGKTADEEPVADESKSEKPVEQEVTDELPAPRSRFGATKEAEEETPTPEQAAEAPTKAEDEASEEKEAPKTPETAPEAPAPKEEEPKSEAVEEETKEPARPKSRFAGGEEPKSEEEAPATPESDEPAEVKPEAESPAEPEVKQEAAAPVAQKTEEEASEPSEKKTAAAETKPETEATEDAPPESEEPPVEEVIRKPAPKAAAAKKTKKPVEPPSEEPEAKADDAEAEPAESGRPRGLARIARSGKYVLGGHCCVTLLENETLKKGNPKLGAIHRGRIYLFASADARKKFLANPDDYSPMLTGYDPVVFADNGELVDGSAEILAKLHDGRVVTFSSEETYKRFAADYKKLREKSPYVEATRSAMKETNGGRHLR